MKDPTQSMQKEMEISRIRMRELENKLAALPEDAGPEILALYGNLLAKEKKFQERMKLAMAPEPAKKAPKFRIVIAMIMVTYFIYLTIFGQAGP